METVNSIESIPPSIDAMRSTGTRLERNHITSDRHRQIDCAMHHPSSVTDATHTIGKLKATPAHCTSASHKPSDRQTGAPAVVGFDRIAALESPKID